MEKKKPGYKLFDNLTYILSKMWNIGKLSVCLLFLKAPISVAASFLGIVFSSQVVAYAQDGKLPEHIIVMVLLLSAALLVATVLNEFCTQKTSSFAVKVDNTFEIEIPRKHCDNDYEISESASGLDRMAKAIGNVGSGESPIGKVSGTISALASNLFGILIYMNVLIVFHPIIPPVIVLTTLFSFLLLKKMAVWSYKNKDHWTAYERKLRYILARGIDFSTAKDIRLYGLGEWLYDIFRDILHGRMAWSKKQQLYNFKIDGLCALCALVRDLVNYGLLVYIVYTRSMSSVDFVFYFGVITAFSTYVSSFAADFSTMLNIHLAVSEIREFLEYPNKTNRGAGLPLPQETFGIEFKNVSFRYEGSERPTIENLTFRIKKGEKIAIVGVNGAGKSTLMKLLCGFYTPTSGEILLNGNPVQSYNIEKYQSLFSAVFQDIFVLPFSIGSNIAGVDDYDKQKVAEVLKSADLWEKVCTLPNGMDTPLIKTVQSDAVDLSGGEMQKLALARALYKNGKFLILDEPTAALDPIAEGKIYEQYHKMTTHCSSVFISHRLSSTRFCDRILLFEGGKIVEEGTHETMMKLDGQYRQMYEIQSHYYREGGVEYDA